MIDRVINRLHIGISVFNSRFKERKRRISKPKHNSGIKRLRSRQSQIITKIIACAVSADNTVKADFILQNIL